MKRILVLAANPKGTLPLRLDEEIREIEAGLERAKKRNQFELKKRQAVRPKDLRRAILDEHPQIVHFSGHGEGESGLVFEDESGKTKPVDGAALAGLFKLFADDVECVVLNGCFSEIQARSIVQHINFVIGMTQAVGDAAAIDFAIAFYDALGAGQGYEFAFNYACNAIELETSGSTQRKLMPVDASGKSLEQKQQVDSIPVLLKKDNLTHIVRETAEDLRATEKASQSRVQQIEKTLTQAEAQLKPELASQLKDALTWLADKRYLSQQASEYLFKHKPEMRTWSDDDKEQFTWEVEKYLEIIYYSLLSESAELLDKPPIMPSLDEPALYREAFEFVRKKIPPRITDQETLNQIRVCFDYLFRVIFP